MLLTEFEIQLSKLETCLILALVKVVCWRLKVLILESKLIIVAKKLFRATEKFVVIVV